MSDPFPIALSKRTQLYDLPQSTADEYNKYFSNIRDFNTQTAETILEGDSLESIKTTDLTSFQRQALIDELQRIQNREKEVQEIYANEFKDKGAFELSLDTHLSNWRNSLSNVYLILIASDRSLSELSGKDFVYFGLTIIIVFLFFALLLIKL